MSDPRKYVIESDRHGFFVVDEFGEEVGNARYYTVKQAKAEIDRLIDNWEPPDPPGWEGGFAKDH